MKDQFLKWGKGEFIYNTARKASITPNSSMAEIKKACLQILEQNFPDYVHETLEELRLVKKRLFVDFFLYQIDGEIASPELWDQEIPATNRHIEPLDLSEFLVPDTSDLQHMDRDFQDFHFQKIEIEYLKLEEKEDDLSVDWIQFDS